MSCSADKQEPIFHLFKSSTEYPDYQEADFLRNQGFTFISVDNTKVLTKLKDGIEIQFVLADNEELETKITRDYLESFDTLSADKAIKDFGGQRTLIWRTEDDSTKLTTVAFDNSKVDVTLRKRGDKIYLESKFDLIHRAVKN